MEALKELKEQNEDNIIKEKANVLQRRITCFDFILTLDFIIYFDFIMFLRQVVLRTKVLVEKLQPEHLNLMTANENLRATPDILDFLLEDPDQIRRQIKAAKAVAENFGSISNDEFQLKHRPRRPPACYSEAIANLGASSLNDATSHLILGCYVKKN